MGGQAQCGLVLCNAAAALSTLRMQNTMPHISVCVCTYKRPLFLKRLLDTLGRQETGAQFTYSIVIADNDHLQSAKTVIADVAAVSRVPIQYCTEPRQNIALARNKAIENSNGDFVAFIDDDEFPPPHWLLTLFTARQQYKADGVLGPVKRHFDERPPAWLLRGNFYQRPTYASGAVIDWTQGRTNNVLMKRSIIPANEKPFRPEFRTGEDQDFFRRMIGVGHVFIWCDEAEVYEVVPPIRWKRGFMLRRAMLQGAASVLHPGFGAHDVGKSLIAVPAYIAALPCALAFGQHRFMIVLIKLADHVGRLLALIGIRVVKAEYVTE
jgi:succinoglycan biosynthesis protein ExoM